MSRSPLLRRRSGRWWVLSVVVHAAIIALLANVVFRYPLGQIMGVTRREIKPERIQYITLPPAAPPASGGGSVEVESAPAPLTVPDEVPTTIPAPVDSGRSQTAGGTGDGLGAGDGEGPGVATGLVPVTPDARIALTPEIVRGPRSLMADLDSIVDLAIGIYVDSMEMVAGQRKPGDWTVKGEDGKVWGWDQGGIRLGKFTIPNALLALLPLNVPGMDPIEYRSRKFVFDDIRFHAQTALNEDELRAAAKRIRERMDRERQERRERRERASQQPVP